MAENDAKTTATVEHVPSGEHGGFPPFQKETFPSQLFWLAVTFVALYLLMSRIALPRVGAILQKRRQHVDADLAEASRLKGESEEAGAAYDKSLADARSRAQTLANETRAKHAAEAEAARKELDAKLNARIAEAEKDIRARQATAMSNVQGIAAETATAILERLVGRAPASSKVAAAVADALKR